MREMNKVFCKDCKFFTLAKDKYGIIWSTSCTANPKSNYVTGGIREESCDIKNWNGECKDYELKEVK